MHVLIPPCSAKTPSVRILGALFVSHGVPDVPDLTLVGPSIDRREHVVPCPSVITGNQDITIIDLSCWAH